MPVRSPYRDAVRVLFILIHGCERHDDREKGTRSGTFRGEKKLHAFDFWVRNPDYLAEELLTLFVETSEPAYFAEAERIFATDEPDLRRFPMIRYRFGAYERLDDTLAILKSRGLVGVSGINSAGKLTEWHFHVTPRAFDLADDILEAHPVLAWYSDRAALVARVAGDRGGNALKERQYKQADYAETQIGGVIPAITTRVRERLTDLKGQGGRGDGDGRPKA